MSTVMSGNRNRAMRENDAHYANNKSKHTSPTTPQPKKALTAPATGRIADSDTDDDIEQENEDAASVELESSGASDDDDDDDDYDAIGDISDGEDFIEEIDEKSVLRSAERDLIEEFQRTEKPRMARAMSKGLNDMEISDETPSRRFSLHSEESLQDADFGLDFTQDPFGGLATTDSLYQELVEDAEGVFDSDLASWRTPALPVDKLAREDSFTSNTTQKRVRFESTPSRTSSMSSDEDPRDAYPDLFASLDDPFMRNAPMLDRARAESAAFGDNESVYDFEDDDKAVLDMEDESDSDVETSESESEDGDTTDEETPDEQVARMRAMKRSKMATVSKSSAIAPATPVAPKQTPNRARVKHQSTPKGEKTPRSGTFQHDPSRASVTVDVNGSGVKLVCPSQPSDKERAYWERARRAIANRVNSPQGPVSWVRSTDSPNSGTPRPLTAKSTLGTMFDGNLDFLRNHDDAGIADHLLKYAATNNLRSPFNPHQHTPSDASDEESNINMEDFVQLSPDSSDYEMDDADDHHESPNPLSSHGTTPQPAYLSREPSFAGSPASQRRPSTPSKAGLLDHFDQQRGLVASFRNNQHLARHVSSLASHPAKRAQTAESNALQAGRRGAANTPMTPARRSRRASTAAESAGSSLVASAGISKKPPPPLFSATSSATAGHSPLKARRRSRGSSLSISGIASASAALGMAQTLGVDRWRDVGSNRQ